MAAADEVAEHAAILEYVTNLFLADDVTGHWSSVAKLCPTLVVRQHGFPAKAWELCVQPYLGCFLPPDAEPDEAKRACELFRTRTRTA